VVQEILSGGCEGPMEWKRENVLLVHDQKCLRKCRFGVPYSHEGLGDEGGTNKWCVVC
jgi:hypothetical protein